MPFRIENDGNYLAISNDSKTDGGKWKDRLYLARLDKNSSFQKWNVTPCKTAGKFTLECCGTEGKFIIAENGADPKLGAKDQTGTELEFEVIALAGGACIKTGSKYFYKLSGTSLIYSKAHSTDISHNFYFSVV